MEEELEEGKQALQILNSEITNIKEFELPNFAGHRTLICVRKINSTSKKYPRKYSEIKKKRL